MMRKQEGASCVWGSKETGGLGRRWRRGALVLPNLPPLVFLKVFRRRHPCVCVCSGPFPRGTCQFLSLMRGSGRLGPPAAVSVLWGESDPSPVLCSYLQKPVLSVLHLNGCWSGSQLRAAEQDPVGDKERITLIRIDLEARPLSLLFLCHQTRSQTLLWILHFNPQNYSGSE